MFYSRKIFTNEECDAIVSHYAPLVNIQSTVTKSTGTVVDLNDRNTLAFHINRNADSEWMFTRIEKVSIEAAPSLCVSLNDPKILNNLIFLKYSVGCFFREHKDGDALTEHNKMLYYRKISCSVSLNDPNEYEGGKLELLPFCKNVPNQKGTLNAFPIKQLHQVTKVTSGIRYALVTWLHDTK